MNLHNEEKRNWKVDVVVKGDEKAEETGVRRLQERRKESPSLPPFHVRDKRHEEEKYGRMIFK